MKILCYNRFCEKIINGHITNIQKLSSYHENATIGFHREEFQRGLATVFKRLDVLVLAAELDGFSFLQMVYFFQNLVQYTTGLCTVKYQRLLPILDELGSSLLELTPNPMISRSFYFQHGEQSKARRARGLVWYQVLGIWKLGFLVRGCVVWLLGRWFWWAFGQRVKLAQLEIMYMKK